MGWLPIEWAVGLLFNVSTFAPVVAVPLLTQVRPPTRESELLESDIRRRIVEAIRSEPGLPVSALPDRLSSAWGTIHHHLWKLERGGLVVRVPSGRRRLLFITGDAPHPQAEDTAHHALLRGKTARRIAESVLEQPHISILDLCELTQETPRVVYYHVRRLIDAGFLSSSSETRYVSLEATPQLQKWIEKVGDAR